MRNVADRMFDCFPAGNYALAGLLRLLDIVETDGVPTAAVECVAQPRLLVNPAFAARHAGTPEKLLMLVMHELHHVLLGHTTLFPRTTPAQNFVFDAVINALISRMFPQPEYVAMLTDFYSDERFPECVLRPPAGWDGRAVGACPPALTRLPHKERTVIEDLYRSLYSEAGASYDEIYGALQLVLDDRAIEQVVLLGGHDGGGIDDAASRSPLLVDTIRPIIEHWAQPPNPVRGRSLADLLRRTVLARRSTPSNRSILRSLIRQVAADHAGGGRFRVRGTQAIPAISAIPALDRRSLVLEALGYHTLLHAASATESHRVPSGDRVHVYIDVSGSMGSLVAAVYGAVLDCLTLVHRPLHLFSTKVADMTLAELRGGVCHSTFGTDIACVADHLETHRIRRAVMITDGCVGRPSGGHLTTLSRTRLGVCYVGESANVDDLAEVANVTACLAAGGRS